MSGPGRTSQQPSPTPIVALVGHDSAGTGAVLLTLLEVAGMTGESADSGIGQRASVDRRRQTSPALPFASIAYDGIAVTLVDTSAPPGAADMRPAGLRAADAALFVVSAVDGIDAATIALWEWCAQVELPRAVLISKLDQPRVDFDESVAVCQRVFGDGILPLYFPVHADDGTPAALIGLLSQQLSDYSGSYDSGSDYSGSYDSGVFPPVVREPDPEHLRLIEQVRNDLVEAIAAEAEDTALVDRYLAGEAIDTYALAQELTAAVAHGALFPVLPFVAGTGLAVGAAELLELVTSAFPAAQEHLLPAVQHLDGRPYDLTVGDAAGPLVAAVLWTGQDASLGGLTLLRTYAGTIRAGAHVHVAAPGTTGPDGTVQSVGRVYHLLGSTPTPTDRCSAGLVCVVTGLIGSPAGATLSDPDLPLVITA